MSDIRLTCDETPLAWPTTVGVDDLTKCGSCGFRLLTSQAGSLQVLTRRQGAAAAGDGVNIEEDPALGLDYRGQRYTYEESILHVPGLHVFPGQKEAYPAEYHLHFKTFSAPQRAVTIVLPVSHKEKGPGEAYFAAAAAKPDPNAKRPLVDTLFVPGSKMIQYRGPDIRGRTKDRPTTDACGAEEERQFLLVLDVARIRATDLERIPREGSLSTDPRDLPAPGVKPKTSLPRDRLLRCAVLADPGVLGPKVAAVAASSGPAPVKELECNPITVQDGHAVVDIKGKPVDLGSMLGSTASATKTEDPSARAKAEQNEIQHRVEAGAACIGTFLGFTIAVFLIQGAWEAFFKPTSDLSKSMPFMWLFIVLASLSASGVSYGRNKGLF